MNERIKQLEAQCWETRKHPVSQAAMGDKFNTEKFAELIVRECVKIIEDEAFNNYNKDKQRHPDSFEAGHDSGMFWSVGMIKEHFGVSE